jgi:hypothetical protein
VPDDPEKTGQVLDVAGIPYTKREVVIVSVLDEPGMLGDVALVMSKAGINIDSVYVTTRGHIVLGVDDLAGALQVAGGMAAMPSEGRGTVRHLRWPSGLTIPPSVLLRATDVIE